MPEKQLRDSLANLRREMAQTEAIDGESQAKLTQVVDRIQQKIDQAENPDQPNLIEHVEDLVRHFEVAHPNLTEALNRVMVALSNLGI